MPGESFWSRAQSSPLPGTLNIFGVIATAARARSLATIAAIGWAASGLSVNLPVRTLHSSERTGFRGRAISLPQAQRDFCVFRAVRRGAARLRRVFSPGSTATIGRRSFFSTRLAESPGPQSCRRRLYARPRIRRLRAARGDRGLIVALIGVVLPPASSVIMSRRWRTRRSERPPEGW